LGQEEPSVGAEGEPDVAAALAPAGFARGIERREDDRFGRDELSWAFARNARCIDLAMAQLSPSPTAFGRRGATSAEAVDTELLLLDSDELGLPVEE
jgi:hypothetical protein